MPRTKNYVVVHTTPVTVAIPDDQPTEEDELRALDAVILTSGGDWQGTIEDVNTGESMGVTYDAIQDTDDWKVVDADGPGLTEDNSAVSRNHGAPDPDQRFPYLDPRDPTELWIWIDAETHLEVTPQGAAAIMASFAPYPDKD